MFPQDLLGYGIVVAVVSIDDVLLLQPVLLRCLMPVTRISASSRRQCGGLPEGTLVATLAFTLDEEAADVRSITLVVRVLACEIFEHFFGGG